MKPQQTRCLEWWVGAPWPRPTRCGRPVTHRVVGRWKNWHGSPERVLVCDRHAARFVKGNSLYSSVVLSAYRVRRAS